MVKKKKSKVPTVEESNASLIKLAEDLNESIYEYEKRGIIHYSCVVGILEDLKLGLLNLQRKNFEDFQDRVKERPSYIG